MQVFQIRTKKTFPEITQKITEFKKIQSENLFGFIEEFDFKNVEFDENYIFIERNGNMINFKTGNGNVIIKPLNENILEVIIIHNKILNKYFKLNLGFSTIFLIFINFFNYYNTNIFSFSFLIFSGVFLIIMYLFYKFIEYINFRLIKDYISRFIKNCS